MANTFSSAEAVTIASTTGTLANTPDGSFFLFTRNGVAQDAGGVDFTLSGSTITLTKSQTGSDVFEAWYTHGGSGLTFSNAETVTIASTTGTLSHIPDNNFFLLTRNGVAQVGNGFDYTQTGTTITLNTAQTGSDVFEAWYSYQGTGLLFSSGELVFISNSYGSLSKPPTGVFFLLARNGVAQKGGGTDFIQSGTDITLTQAQTGDDRFNAWYTYSTNISGDNSVGLLMRYRNTTQFLRR